ncbi:homeobox protein aristaless-like 4 [Arapaima gigas]
MDERVGNHSNEAVDLRSSEYHEETSPELDTRELVSFRSAKPDIPSNLDIHLLTSDFLGRLFIPIPSCSMQTAGEDSQECGINCEVMSVPEYFHSPTPGLLGAAVRVPLSGGRVSLPRAAITGMNAETCVSYCDMTSMDSYYGAGAAQGRELQGAPFRTFPPGDAKYSPTFLSGKGQPYGEKPRSPFQQDCPSLDAPSGEGSFSKYQIFMQRSSCKTPPEEGKVLPEGAHSGALISCYGEYSAVQHSRTQYSTAKPS